MAFERYTDSDSESVVSFGAEADARLEMPIVTAHGLLGRLVSAASRIASACTCCSSSSNRATQRTTCTPTGGTLFAVHLMYALPCHT